MAKTAMCPPTPTPVRRKGPVATINKQSMRYFIVRDIESDTSYLKENWPAFALKELSDNAYDWLNTYYPAKKPEDKALRKITSRIWLTRSNEDNPFIHIAVRNSNADNFPAFTNLKDTFNYDNFYSTKRGQHFMTAGGLGDALKRILGMGYAIWSEIETEDEDNELELEEKQWNEPIIIRCNGTERKCLLTVERSKGERWVDVKHQPKPSIDIGTDTEVEVTLVVEGYAIPQMRTVVDYAKRYPVAKSRTIFDFQNKGEVQ